MKNEDMPLVSICCLTYNHAPYIRQCLDGFMMQKTDYLFEVVVHDDASTDGTQDVIREYEKKYPDVVKPIYQVENQYSQQIDIFGEHVMPSLKGKYIAFCEGDDYWIDPLKLQKQVAFLEKDKTYGLIYSKSIIYYNAKKKFGLEYGFNDIRFDTLINGSIVPTLTVMTRKALLINYLNEIKPASKRWLVGDLPMFLWFAENSNIYFYPEVQAVYRILNNSASHFTDPYKKILFYKSLHELHLFFIDKYRPNNEKLYLQSYFNYVNIIFREGCIRNDKQILAIITKEKLLNRIPFSVKKYLIKCTLLFEPLRLILHIYTKIRGINS